MKFSDPAHPAQSRLGKKGQAKGNGFSTSRSLAMSSCQYFAGFEHVWPEDKSVFIDGGQLSDVS